MALSVVDLRKAQRASGERTDGSGSSGSRAEGNENSGADESHESEEASAEQRPPGERADEESSAERPNESTMALSVAELRRSQRAASGPADGEGPRERLNESTMALSVADLREAQKAAQEAARRKAARNAAEHTAKTAPKPAESGPTGESTNESTMALAVADLRMAEARRAAGLTDSGLDDQATMNLSVAGLRAAVTERVPWPYLLRLAAPLIVGLVLWLVAVALTDASNLTDYGLVPKLPIVFWVGLAALTVGFWIVVRDPQRSNWWPFAYTMGLLLMERATQAMVYPTPLYAWAWKHDAVIDHLIDAGRLQRGAELGDMAVYDQWPGFFTAQAALVELTGAETAASFMAWWPLFSSLLLLGPLLLIYRTFTQDRRLIWTAVWIFYVANWVGQDYYSPQSLAFALHLGVIAVALRRAERRAPGRRSRQMVWTALLVPLIAGIVIAHQLTPVMLAVSLGSLLLMRRYRDWTLLIILMLVFLSWNLTASLPFLKEAVPDMINSFGKVADNLERGYGAKPTGTGALVASWAARILSAAVVLLAAIGLVRGGKLLRHRARPLLLLAGMPPLLAIANGYGSEMIFRVLMFMLPALCFFAAAALLPVARPLAAEPGGKGRPTTVKGFRYGVVPAVVLVMLTALFVPSYSGKDRLSYFPPEEVALVQKLFDQAPKGSLVVAAHRNYPLAYDSYWDVGHYWFLDDAKTHVDAIVKDPAGTLASDMGGVEPPGKAYLLLTQGQMANSEMNGMLTGDDLRNIERSVAASPLFKELARNSAGVFFELKRTPAPPAAKPAAKDRKAETGAKGRGEEPAKSAENAAKAKNTETDDSAAGSSGTAVGLMRRTS
ncbi:glycosyltransferase [Streptomyces albipurpureus]|uniref:Glycosyltransferase n=1 Tax=Streptomyces albipurpureus TaxID=2897419 RepID=A0ABT0UNC7_9ACTN|nr:glycosyltransferase [Streptomyces sp. CWNU-1]MCM2390112.1 glycosyltransferase [Streptomyces sp. CWNU-1]